MGQIVSAAAKPKRCNANQLSQVPTPAAGEHILVSSDNSMNAAGQGNFDAYVVGDGRTAATALKLRSVDTFIGAFDISAYHATGDVLAKYADLSAALGANGANILQSLRKGGMSVKFVQSSDNKYVEYFLPKGEWSIDPNDWEKKNLEDEVNYVRVKVDGKIYPKFQQGTIDNNTGAPFFTDTRVRTEAILLDRPIKVEISGDVTNVSVYVAFQSTELGLPKLNMQFPADGIINPIEGYPYVVFLFQRKSDITSNIGIDEVAQNTSFTYQDALEVRVTKIESDVTSIQGNISDIDADIFNLKGALTVTKTLPATGGQIYLKEYNWGKCAAVKLVSSGITTTGNISVDFRMTGNTHDYQNLVLGKWTAHEGSVDIDRIYIYTTSGVSAGGDVTVEIIFGSTYDLTIRDEQPTQGSNRLVTSGGVYDSVQNLNNDIGSIDVDVNGRYNYIDGYYLDANGALVANEGSCVSDYIPVDKDVQKNGVTCYYGTYNSGARLCFYDTNKALLNAYGQVSGANSRTIYAYQIASAKYVRLSFTKNYTDAGLFDVFTNVYLWQPAFINGVKGDTEDLKDLVFGDTADIKLVQGNYNNGIPGSVPSRIRTDRMILAAELPMTVRIPDNVDIRIYSYCRYATANDYTSYADVKGVNENNYKELILNSDLIGENKGITLVFSSATSISTNITPADGDGIQFKYTKGVVQEIDERLDELEAGVENGNTTYYGRKQTLKITDESHKLTSTMKLEHTYNSYPHTVYNQSMAIWDGKYFCFNDTSAKDGLCVVVDIATNTILDYVTTVPQEIGNTHLNNAVFTDVYYLADDDYPLLLLSRGDYADNGNAMEAFHIVRVTEESGHFVFTHIKKVIVHTAYTHFNPSWCYDRQRKMVWCYSYTQDWRYNRSTFRNFNGYPLPIYSESSYICITSGDNVAAVDTDVEIIVTGVTRTIHVTAGNGFEEVFAFTPNSLGLGVVKVTQSVNNAFTGMWVAYDCDSNGDDKVELVSQAVISGFKSPELADPTQVELDDDDIVSTTFIDWGIYQGGDSANGKLYLPYQEYNTINGEPTAYTGHCCMVVDPVSGYIESIIPTDTLENEGCAIYNGKLYISSHDGNGASTPTSVCFRIMEYSFD